MCFSLLNSTRMAVEVQRDLRFEKHSASRKVVGSTTEFSNVSCTVVLFDPRSVQKETTRNASVPRKQNIERKKCLLLVPPVFSVVFYGQFRRLESVLLSNPLGVGTRIIL